MPVIYLDQNALLALGHRCRVADFRQRVDEAIKSGAVRFALSSWHLIETARGGRVERATELADFIDSLAPLWLLERRDIQAQEVRDDFFRYLKIKHESAPRLTTRTAMIATLNGQKDSPKFDIPSRAFVQQWMTHPDQLRPLEKPYCDNINALIGMREAVKAGKLTKDIERRSDEKLIDGLLPKFTPAGLEIGVDLKKTYIKQLNIASIPSLAIERAISQHEWLAAGNADRNSLIDKFHLISGLPYVDEIVSDDKFFHTLYPEAAKTGHVKAKLLHNDEFLKRF